jgi:hypothetical protein
MANDLITGVGVVVRVDVLVVVRVDVLVAVRVDVLVFVAVEVFVVVAVLVAVLVAVAGPLTTLSKLLGTFDCPALLSPHANTEPFLRSAKL